MQHFFDPSIPAPLRRFYVLCLGSCAGNLAGVLANAAIHGLSLPTLFCFCCMLAVFALSAFGCVTRRCQPACYALLFVLVFVEFPALYYIYGAPTTPYLILGIVGLAIFIPHQQAALLATLAFAWDLFVMSMAHLFPAQLEPVTADAAFSSALCTFTIVAFCLFAITVLLLAVLPAGQNVVGDGIAQAAIFGRRLVDGPLRPLPIQGDNISVVHVCPPLPVLSSAFTDYSPVFPGAVAGR